MYYAGFGKHVLIIHVIHSQVWTISAHANVKTISFKICSFKFGTTGNELVKHCYCFVTQWFSYYSFKSFERMILPTCTLVLVTIVTDQLWKIYLIYQRFRFLDRIRVNLPASNLIQRYDGVTSFQLSFLKQFLACILSINHDIVQL